MNDQEIVKCLKVLQRLLERSVNGNQETHNLLKQLITSTDRMLESNERTAEFMQKSWEAYMQAVRKQ